jgi:hypothetical protein
MKAACFLGAALACLAASAWANDEYVDPNFCYRVILPDASSRATPAPDGSGVTLEVGTDCPHRACVRLQVLAFHIRAKESPEPQDPFPLQGWTLRSIATARVSGIAWSRRTMTKGAITRVEYRTTQARDTTQYVVVASYPHGLRDAAEKALGQVLASWRFISECV